MFSTVSLSRAIATAALIATTALAACGDDDSGSSDTKGKAPSVGKNEKVAALVPDEVKKKGTLTVAADATYPPNEFIKPGTKQVIGFDPDLADALGKVMGLKVKVVNATFDAIIPGLAAKKYDLGMSSFTDTKEREATVDFVTYFEAGTSFYAKSDNVPKVNGLADLCGLTVAVEKGTTQADDSNAQSKKCTKAGKKPVKVLVFPDQNGANLALSSGRGEVGMADSPVAAYQVKQSNGQFKLIGNDYGPFPYGIAIPKKTGLDKPVLEGIKVLMSNGVYKAILKKWGIERGGIDNPGINKAIS